jgi:iron complex outermembrane receptor protein
MQKSVHRLSVIAMVLTSGSVFGQSAPAESTGAAGNNLESIIVTGTRATGVKASDSAEPIEIIDAATLQRTGQPDLIQALAQVLPSFIAQGFGYDTAGLTLSAALRGLNPNDTLILVNGKRLHSTANLAVDNESPYQGAAAPDLSFIPVSAVDHVEVLVDGAAAQYGTDAIAGVINIILKSADHGGLVIANTGAYMDQGGFTTDASANIGLQPLDGAFLNLTVETKTHEHSDRGSYDPRVVSPSVIAANPTVVDFPGYPNVNQISGDAQYRLSVLTFNSGIKLGGDLEAYAFGTYGYKNGSSYENYRLPSIAPTIYPLGFNPSETLDEVSSSVTFGVKGKAFGGWSWDASSTYGRDSDIIGVINSANQDLIAAFGTSPTIFNAGQFISTQWTNNFDLTHDLNLGFAEPAVLALGLENRRDTYQIVAGDFASRYADPTPPPDDVPGAQSFPGFTTTDAGQHERTSNAFYADLIMKPLSALTVDTAVRHEEYSDFGSATVGKLTGRLDVTDNFALRGTLSTGFRAPTLAEEYYSSTDVSPTSAFVQLPPNSAGARLIGVDGLKPEKSNNFSFGFIAEPVPHLSISVDIYQIDIRDRIVGSGALYDQVVGTTITNASVSNAIIANGNSLPPASLAQSGVELFTNAANTRTRGLESVLNYSSDFGQAGKVNWSAGLNLTDNTVTKINQTPTQLLPQVLLNAEAISDLTTVFPRFRLNLGALYTLGPWSINVRESIYGPTWEQDVGENGTTFYENKISTKAITDLEIRYRINKSWTAAVGANNLFNTYPNQYSAAYVAQERALPDPAAVSIYPAFSPFGINGGYYYGKLTYTF